MCVIVYKPRGREINNLDLYDCYLSNPDGCGYMYQDDDQVIISKGYFDLAAMLKDVESNIDDIKGSDIVFHFRIATSGKIDKRNCHPFAVSDSLFEMGKTENKSDFGFAHNGTLVTSIWRKSDLKVNCDSMLFVADILAPMINGSYDYLENGQFSPHIHDTVEMIARSNKSRFILMSKDDVTMYGNDWKTIRGCYYSNDYWDNYSRYSGWDYDKCEICGKTLIENFEFYYGICDNCTSKLEAANQAEDGATFADIEEIEWCDYCGDTTENSIDCNGFILCQKCANQDDVFGIGNQSQSKVYIKSQDGSWLSIKDSQEEF